MPLRVLGQKCLKKGEHKKTVEMLIEVEPLEKIAKYTKLSTEEIKSL